MISSFTEAATEGTDCVIVPGGGLNAGGEVPLWVAARLERAMECADGRHIIVLSAGTPHKPPPIDPSGIPVLECVAEAKFLLDHGYPATRILMENASYDTIGNAYFSRVIHVDPAGFRRLRVITSEFHAARTEFVFRWIFALDPKPHEYELFFEAVPTVGMAREAIDVRRQKEAESSRTLCTLVDRYTTLAEFHRWLFEEHGAYRALPAIYTDRADKLLLQSC
jgi:hypothetical protein